MTARPSKVAETATKPSLLHTQSLGGGTVDAPVERGWGISFRCAIPIVQNPMSLRTLKFVARDPFISREQQLAAASLYSIGYEGYDQYSGEVSTREFPRNFSVAAATRKSPTWRLVRRVASMLRGIWRQVGNKLRTIVADKLETSLAGNFTGKLLLWNLALTCRQLSRNKSSTFAE